MSFSCWFKAPRFKFEAPGQEAVTQKGWRLALWLHEQLIRSGITVDGVLPEDWGCWLVCNKGEVKILIGCGPMDRTSLEPNASATIWHCFVEPRARWWQRIRFPDQVRLASEEVAVSLLRILSEHPDITLVDEP